MKKSKSVETVETKPKYTVTLTMGNEIHKGEGESPIEALQAMPKPLKMTGKAVFQITDGVRKSREVLMYPIRLRRLFYNKMFQSIQLKSLCLGMK